MGDLIRHWFQIKSWCHHVIYSLDITGVAGHSLDACQEKHQLSGALPETVVSCSESTL